MAEALLALDKSGKVIVLTDSQAPIAAIKKAERMGQARTRQLRKVKKKIEQERRVLGRNAVSLARFKCHIGLNGNEEEDKKAKPGTNSEDPAFPVITEGGLKKGSKKIGKEERCMRGTGEGRVVKWE